METNRLRLIEVDPARDSIAYNEVIVKSFDSLHPWVSWAEKLPALEDTRRKLDEIHEGRLQGVRAGFGIYLKDGNILIGNCGLTALRGPIGERIRHQIDSPDYKNPWLIGYWISKDYEGRGYMTEACTAMIEWGIKELHIDCYFIGVDPKNTKSAGVPKSTVMETNRLKLIEVDPARDAAAFNEVIVNTFDSLHPWLLFADKVPTLEDTRRTLETYDEDRLKGLGIDFGMYLKDTNTLIGTCGLIALRGHIGERIRHQIDSPDYKNPWLIAYWISKHYEGHGYVTEACSAMIQWGSAKMGIDCYFAEVDPQNAKSGSVAKRLGFEFWGRTMVKNMERSDWPEELPCDIYRKLMSVAK